ncbi:MAG: hypothetical protein AAFP98_06525 [Pseudomonadota bacterium]
MKFHETAAWATSCEFGAPQRVARVDPAKTLGLIKRIQDASGTQLAPPRPAIASPQPLARAG